MNAGNQQIKRFPNDILLLEWHQFEMPLKKTERLVHKMIAVLRQAASRKSSPKDSDQTSSIEVTSYFNGAPDNIDPRRTVIERVVGHRKR